jgi:predicted ATPase
VSCRGFALWALWVLGYPDQALRRSHEALCLARELSHPYGLAWALYFAVLVHLLRREGPRIKEPAEEAIALATEQGFAPFLAWVTLFRGWALAMQDHREEGVVQLRQSLAAWRAMGAESLRPYGLALLAEADALVGQLEAGLAVVAEALGVVDTTGERCWEAELHRLKGELLLARSSERAVEAEACFRQALGVAGRQQAKSLELRAAISLSHLWQRQGQRAEARELLAPLYGWFTEGFDTTDLQEAKALLEELS